MGGDLAAPDGEETQEDVQGLGLLLAELVVVGDLAAPRVEEDQEDAQGLELVLAVQWLGGSCMAFLLYSLVGKKGVL